MEVDNETNPSQIKSLLNVVDLNKKRKLEAEQFGLPVSKHQCWKQILPSKPPTFGGINPGVEGISPCTFNGKGVYVYDVSEIGSGKDSNSFPGNSDSAMSFPAEAKFGTTEAKYLLYDSASSSDDCGFSCQSSRCSSDGTTVASRGVGKEVLFSTDDVELAENLEESLVEHGNHIDYIYSGYRNYDVEQYQDKEIEEILDSDEANPKVYVLSSGRWTVNQESRQTTRKPTIDQEFEQYFSMLML